MPRHPKHSKKGGDHAAAGAGGALGAGSAPFGEDGNSSRSSSSSTSPNPSEVSSRTPQESEETKETLLEAGRHAAGEGDGLLTGLGAGSAAVPGTARPHGESEASDYSGSSADSQEEERTGGYKFDAVTEYMMQVGHQDAQLSAAWDFFARFTLPTYTVWEDAADRYHRRKYRLQEPGEPGGQFYHLWKTPLAQLGDFGVGMGLYFQTLFVMGTVFLLAGLANTAGIMYYRSDAYSGGQHEVNEQISKGSAACTLRSVVCLDETCTTWEQDHRPCQLDLLTGMIDLGTTIVLFMVLFVVGKLQDRHARKIDESEQTAADYSIMVQDPNPGDVHATRWKQFFERRFGPVTYVTVAVQGGKLMRVLAERFSLIEKIRYEAASQEEEDMARDPSAIMTRDQYPVSCWQSVLMKAGLATDIVMLHERMVALDAELKRLQAPKKATKVFVVFEKEASQRECLRSMTTGLLKAGVNHVSDDKEDLVCNGNVLSVSEAPEPGDIIWENLQVSVTRRALEFVGRMLVATVLLAVVGYIVLVLSKANPIAAAAFIAINNSLLPGIMMWLTVNPKGGEHHHTNSSYQRSLMLKIVLAQWMNTGFIIYVIQNIDTSPSEAYVNQISKILWADAFTQPLMQVLDIKARFEQYVLAPFQKTQAKMNKYFLGTPVVLAERYASMLKTMFVCLFFSAIFPQGYYVAAMAMFMTYWSSKYCLFYRWRTPQACDDSLTVMTRRYLAIALVVHILVSAQYYSGWPFDGYCPTEQTVTQAFADQAQVDTTHTASYTVISAYPQVGDPVYELCEQDSAAVWGEWPKDWMPDDQAVIVLLFSILGIVSTALVAVMLFGKTIYHTVRRLVEGAYKPIGRATTVGFSEVHQIQAYVPEVKDSNRAQTLLATDLTHVNTHHISWTGDFNAYNLCSAEAFPNLTRKERADLFSRVVYYPRSKDGDRGLPTPTRMRGIPLVSDETTPLRLPVNAGAE